MLNRPTQQMQDLNNYMQNAVNAARQGNVQQLVQMKLQQNPQLAQAYINLSDLYYKAGNIASAVGTLQKGSYELQDNLTIAHLLARVYIDDQRWEDAIEELERVLDGEPENYDAYYDLGHVCFELGDYEAAISNFENVGPLLI